jgi:cation diffusion facilitator family transporter
VILHPPPDEPGTATPAERARAAARSTWVSVAVNLVLTAAQIAIGLAARSQALVADGLHSLSDLVSDFVVLFVNRHSHKGADAEHPYGHQRFENAATLLLGALLMSVGAGMLWSAVNQLATPSAAGVQPAALWMALFTLAAKELLFRYLLRVAQRLKSSMLVANAWHARSDAASSLVVALGIGGSLAGYPFLDAVAALIVGLMIVRMGWRYGWGSLNDLMDHAVDQEEVDAIRTTLAATDGVAGVHDVRTRKMGDMVLVDAHIEVDASLSVEAGHDIALAARERVMQQHHRVLNVMTHVDPWHAPAHTPSP